jgi:hypothetical protein
MLKQIFRKNVPNELLFAFLEKICVKYEKHYYIDINAFQKMKFYNYHTEFCASLKEYYHLSKYFYLERTMTYNSFINIIRQICKSNSIVFSSKMKYNESKYNIDYFIYFQWLSTHYIMSLYHIQHGQ